MSLYPDSGDNDGSVGHRGMTEGDWRRLHGRVIPNPITYDDFKTAVADGKLQDQYLAKDLHKIMQEMRDILKEHGELREAASFPLSGRKVDLGRAAAAAVRVLDGAFRGSSEALAGAVHPLPSHRAGPPPLSTPPAGEASAALEVRARLSDSPTLDSGAAGERSPPTDDHARTPLLTSAQTSPARTSRSKPITDHITDAPADVFPARAAVDSVTETGSSGQQFHSSDASDPRLNAAAAARRTWNTNTDLRRTIALNAATTEPSRVLHESAGASTDTAAPSSLLYTLPAPAVSVAPPLPPPSSVRNEVAALGEYCSPFAVVVSVAKRFQLRYGSHPLRFEVPVQYAAAISTRRLRLHLIPLRSTNAPWRWPVAKEIVVYVNDQCVRTPWRRAWPERKEEVAKTYLPLDITQLLTRNTVAQRLQVDVFNKEYFTPAILAVVQPNSAEDVVERILEKELSHGDIHTLKAALMSNAFPSDEVAGAPGIAANNVKVMRFYQRVMEDDVEEGLEVDDPVITTKCPISQLSMDIPVRGRACDHLQCVDLQSYLVSCHKGSYWNCVLCDRELRPSSIVIDTVLWQFLLRATSAGKTFAYLRLSVLSASSADKAADGTAPTRYFWHPSRPGGNVGDFVVDESASEADGERDEKDPALREPATVNAQVPGEPTKEQCDDSALPTERSQKRVREEGPAEADGSEDNPIEL